MLMLFVVFLPLLGAALMAFCPAKSDRAMGNAVCFATGFVLLCMLRADFAAGDETVLLPLLHLSFRLGGFQRLYGTVVCFMWFVSALLSPQYFDGHHRVRRYYVFFLLCLGFTAGVFLSADLYTTFLFFELMSLGSYVWVAQEETPAALEAGRTYLIIAVLGGMVTLMGLFLLQHLTGTLVIAELSAACAAIEDRGALWAAAVCLLVGFAAKAGMFPLHIWLPKAHPVAPAPASALLSGVLTKAGIFGVILITAQILPHDIGWGNMLLAFAVVTMVLGAVIAVFSDNLKYILACSSLSQIGFILVGVSMLSLLGEHNALAAHGTVLYMLNHSLVKLTLFLFAGIVYAGTHALTLGEIRGFGRGKPLLHALFLCGAASLAGIPGFCGYLSKTLVHEAVVELAAETGMGIYTAVEWLFLLSGGLTAAYLTKIYLAVFWQKPARAADKRWGTPMSVIALLLAALPLPLLGLTPHILAEPIAALTLPFTGGHPMAHAVHYFAPENLKGVAISLAIGMAVYFLPVRLLLMRRTEDGAAEYLQRWPRVLDIEKYFYYPVCGFFYRLLHVLCRLTCDLPDFLILLGRYLLLGDNREKPRHRHPLPVRLLAQRNDVSEEEMADRLDTAAKTFARVSAGMAFSLLMTCVGLTVTLLVLILRAG